MNQTIVEEDYYDPAVQPVREKVVTLQPGTGKAVGLGIYADSTPDPDFEISYQPDQREDVGLSHEKLEIPGKNRYMLLYQFHNFSEKAIRVTLHAR